MSGALVALVRDGLVLALLLVAPILVAALVAGILVGILGRVTQLEDPTLAMVARVAAVGVAVIGFGPSIAHQLMVFATHTMSLVAGLGATPAT